MKYTFCAILMLLLSACASSTKITTPIQEIAASGNLSYSTVEVRSTNSSGAPEHFLVAIKSYLQSELEYSSALSDDSPYAIDIEIFNYSMRDAALRVLVGALAGEDSADSIVKVKDLHTGKIIGESVINSYDVTIFGGMDSIAKMHAEEIAKFVVNKKKRITVR